MTAITWSISGTDAARFSISSSGALTFKSAPDYEKPNDGDKKNDYEITIQASDGSLTSTLSVVEITVTNVNESGPYPALPASTTPRTAQARLRPTRSRIRKVTASRGASLAQMRLDSPSPAPGALTFKSAPDYEKPNDGDKKNDYEVTIQASDGSLTATLDVEVYRHQRQ